MSSSRKAIQGRGLRGGLGAQAAQAQLILNGPKATCNGWSFGKQCGTIHDYA